MKREFFYDVLIASGTAEYFCPDHYGYDFADHVVTPFMAETAIENAENPITIGSFKSLSEAEKCLRERMPEMAIDHAEKISGYDHQYNVRVIGGYLAVYEVETTDEGETDSWDMRIVEYSRFPQREVKILPPDLLPE